jgi:hypothetical protein
MNTKEFHREEITKMIRTMNNPKFLESIYFFIKVMFEKEKK